MKSQADIDYNIRIRACVVTACADAAQLTTLLQARQSEHVQDGWDAAPDAHLVVSAGMG